LGDDHPHVARARFNLGGVFVEQGDLDRAAAEYAAVVGIRERTLGDKHPQVGRVLASLGQTELDRGRIESARDALARALEILEADATGIDPHLVGRVEYLLAQALQRGGRRTDARSHARSARKRLVEVGAADRVGEIDAWLRALAAGPPG
jgi:tetratricopeptide (TPR) repeat protein